MSTAWLLVIILLVLLIAGSPYTGWHAWGWQPSGLIAVVLAVVLVLLVLGRI